MRSSRVKIAGQRVAVLCVDAVLVLSVSKPPIDSCFACTLCDIFFEGAATRFSPGGVVQCAYALWVVPRNWHQLRWDRLSRGDGCVGADDGRRR